MSDQSDLSNIESFVTTFIDRLKAEVESTEAEARSGFFAKGIDLITIKISDGSANVELTVAGAVAPAPKNALPVIPDRLVQPMFVELPLTPNTNVKSVSLEVDVVLNDGQTLKRVVTNLPFGSTTISI